MISMGNDALEHIETLRRVAALAARLCLDVSGGLMTIRNGHSGSEWTKRLNDAVDEIDRAMEHLVQVPSILSQDYAECDEDCAVDEDEGAGGKYASADAYEDAFYAAVGPDPTDRDAGNGNDVGWQDLSARFAALPGWASEAVVTTTCGDQPASFFPGGPYRYTYDDGVFKFYECDGGQVADHGVLDLRGTTRYPVNNLCAAEIVAAHWSLFKAGYGSVWDSCEGNPNVPGTDEPDWDADADLLDAWCSESDRWANEGGLAAVIDEWNRQHPPTEGGDA